MGQLSAEYITTRGSRGVAFVAYDKARHLLRLDSDGRKSIYDLIDRRSYHVGEFTPIGTDPDSSSPTSLETKADLLLERCVILDMDQQVAGNSTVQYVKTNPMFGASTRGSREDDSQSAAGVAELSLIEKLIGLNQDDQQEYYLGTRTIDHVAYEVFGREWSLEAGDVPVLLRASKYRLPVPNGDKRIYLTYYVRLENQQLQQQQEEEDSPPPPLMILQFIEMWEFDAKLKRKLIINRLRFVEFSWSLDVEPTNGDESRLASPTLRLFNIEPCYQERARQAEVVVEYKRDKDAEQLTRSQVDVLRANELEIGEHLVKLIASTLEVSRLNLVELKLNILPTGNMISSYWVVDLRPSLSALTAEGSCSRMDSI